MPIVYIKFLKALKVVMLCAALQIVAVCAKAQMAEVRQLQKSLPKQRDSLKYIDALNRIGLLLHTKSADSTFFYGIKAKAIADRLEYNKGRAEATVNIAIALTLKGIHNQGLTYYIEGRNLFLKEGLQEPATELLMNIAISYDFLGNSKMAVKFAKEALEEAKGLKRDSAVSMLLVNYVNLDYSLSPKAVNKYLDSAKKIADKYHDDRTILFLKQVKAHDQIVAKDYAAAYANITSSIKTARAHEWEYHEMEGLYLLAGYYKKQNNIDSAIKNYQTIYTMALKNNYVYWEVEILELLADAYKQKNNTAEQLRLNKLLIAALKKSNEANSSFMGDYVKYNQTEQELTQFKADYANKRKETAWLIGLLTVIICITILLLALYKKSRRHERELEVLNGKINLQNRELQQADEFKSRLISMLAHDFRSPLGSAIAMMRLVRDDDDLEKQEREMLYNSIETDMQNILLTFDNILHWVKKQMSGFVYQPETLPVHQLLDEAAMMFKDVISIKNLTLHNRAPEELEITTDKEVIQFINRNLIHNAVKFTPNGGNIVLNARHQNNETVFSVEDNGKGMSPEKIASLFSVNQTETDSQQGAGIALTICKDFVSKLGGRIWAESKAVGGVIFYFSLPDGKGIVNE